MLYYRLYFISCRDGHIRRFEEFEVEDDAAAMALARRHEGEDALELWNEHRKVGMIEPNDLASKLLARRRAQLEAPDEASEDRATTG